MIKHFFYKYNPADTTNYNYGRLEGPFQGYEMVKTTGSATAIAPAVAGRKPFAGLAAGDVCVFRSDAAGYLWRRIVTFTDSGSIAVDTAVDLSAANSQAWTFFKSTVDTTPTSGWQDVSSFITKTLYVDIPTNGDGIAISVEAENPGGNAIELYTASWAAAATTNTAVPIGEDVVRIRVGVKGTATTTETDSVSIKLVGDVRTP
jgi:hypothetical protein